MKVPQGMLVEAAVEVWFEGPVTAREDEESPWGEGGVSGCDDLFRDCWFVGGIVAPLGARSPV